MSATREGPAGGWGQLSSEHQTQTRALPSKTAPVSCTKQSGTGATAGLGGEAQHGVLFSLSRPYQSDPSFDPEFIMSKSTAAAGLCSWCLNIVRFYEVYCDVEPKRQALEEANAELAEAQEKLSRIKHKIAVSARCLPGSPRPGLAAAACGCLPWPASTVAPDQPLTIQLRAAERCQQ